MQTLLIFLGVIFVSVLVVIAGIALFVTYKANKFKNKVEDTVIDAVKETIVKHGPETVKYIKNKIEKK
jgi:ABC-type methionine transport system permease subunit